MSKIKITEKETKLEGLVEKGNVKPFGTSAHIPFTKKHMGKKVYVVVPDNGKLVWVLSDKDKQIATKSVEKYIIEQNGKVEHYRLGMLKNIQEDDFVLDDLIKFIQILINSGNQSLGSKIKMIYNL